MLFANEPRRDRLIVEASLAKGRGKREQRDRVAEGAGRFGHAGRRFRATQLPEFVVPCDVLVERAPQRSAGRRDVAWLSRFNARMAELGLHAADLSGIAGSGAAGRLTIQDFEKFLAQLEKNKTCSK